jgi:hypothetical protein
MPIVASGANMVNAPIIPSFLTQPAAPKPSPLSPTPSSTPISPLTPTSLPPSVATAVPPSPLSPALGSAPALPSSALPDSLPPVNLTEIPTPDVLNSAPATFKRAVPRKLNVEEGEKEKEGEVPAELAAIFKEQIQLLAQQQQQIMQKQQVFKFMYK